MGTRAPTAQPNPAGTECPADDVLGAHLARELDDKDTERVGAHIDRCNTCRELVVAFTRTPLTPAPSGSLASGSIDLSRSLPSAFGGRYQLKRLIGTGGMGAVYEALDVNLHRLVALKVLRVAPEAPHERTEAASRLVREARAMAVLSHRHVVAVYDVGQDAEQVFVAMQLIDGSTLRAWLAAQPRRPLQVLRVLADAGAGLAAAHAAGLVHRDFKPDNVLISRRGTARVTDFGLARRADLLADAGPERRDTDRGSRPIIVEMLADNHTVTRTGAVVGTPAYMAPEQAQGHASDARADQFSFCVTAWEALYGQRPFAGTTWSEIYANVMRGSITEPPRGSRVPRRVERALRRGLTADPAARFPSMSALLAVLELALRKPGMRKRGWMITFIALGAAIAAVLIWDHGKEVIADLQAEDPPAAATTATLRRLEADVAALPAAERAVYEPLLKTARGAIARGDDATATRALDELSTRLGLRR
jgi:hypothetical protein